jgi:hypothetical protein
VAAGEAEGRLSPHLPYEVRVIDFPISYPTKFVMVLTLVSSMVYGVE